MLKKILISIIFIFAYNLATSCEVPNNYSSDSINKVSINLFTFQLGTNKNLPDSRLPLSDQIDQSEDDGPMGAAMAFGIFAFISSFFLCVLGGFSMLISIPFLASGIYGYTRHNNEIDKNYIIAGGVLLGAGFVCCLPMIIIGIFIAAVTCYSESNTPVNKKLNFPILPDNPIPKRGKFFKYQLDGGF